MDVIFLLRKLSNYMSLKISQSLDPSQTKLHRSSWKTYPIDNTIWFRIHSTVLYYQTKILLTVLVTELANRAEWDTSVEAIFKILTIGHPLNQLDLRKLPYYSGRRMISYTADFSNFYDLPDVPVEFRNFGHKVRKRSKRLLLKVHAYPKIHRSLVTRDEYFPEKYAVLLLTSFSCDVLWATSKAPSLYVGRIQGSQLLLGDVYCAHQ